MKHSFKKYLIALSLLPLISLSGCTTPTSPPPGVRVEGYQDYTATYVKEETSGEDVLTTFHIKNTGMNYLASVGIYENKDGETLFSSSEGFGTPFKSAVIPTNGEKDVVFKTARAFTDKDNLNIAADAYNRGGGSSSIKGEPALVNLNGSVCYVRGIEIMGSLMMKRPTTLYYGVVIEVEYDGETYYFACDEDHDFAFSTYYPLDSSMITKVEVAGIISSDKPTSTTDYAYAALIIIVGILLISLMIAPIFLAFLIPLLILRKRRKNAAK